MTRVNADLGAALAELTAAHAALRDHKSAQTYLLLTHWIDAVAAAQQAAMSSIRDGDKLQVAQARLHQLLALRDALRSDEYAPTGSGYLADL